MNPYPLMRRRVGAASDIGNAAGDRRHTGTLSVSLCRRGKGIAAPLQDSETDTKTQLGYKNIEVEFEDELTKLMPFLRFFAQSLSGNREFAEDLAQEALAKAWRSRRSFDRGSNLKAWVCTILRNEYFSYRRRSWRQVPWDPEFASAIPAPDGEQQWAVELSDTARAMHGLTDAQREALILVGVSGFSYVDAALLTGSTVGTTKSRVARARKLLRDILDGRSLLRPRGLDAGRPRAERSAGFRVECVDGSRRVHHGSAGVDHNSNS
jgi:RNA polymerase sigma-70 factor (ECF subfamily)